MTNKELIEKTIPHRDNMLLLDEMREYNERSGVGVHYVRADEFWCSGHFPVRPIMPGVLMIEALAQVGCFVILAQIDQTNGRKVGFFTSMDKVRFSRMVHPGDVLELNVECVGQKLKFYKFKGIAMVAGVKVCEATFSAYMDDYDAG